MTTLYYRLADNTLRAAATGSDVPKLIATLRSTFSFDVAFVTAAGLVAPLVAPEAGSVVVKAVIKLAPEDDAILLDATVVSNAEAGTARRYTAAWTAEECDSAAFRAAVLGKTQIQATLEIEVTHADGTARAVTPVTLVNAFFQPLDTAPDPGEDASWTWLKARLNAGDDMSFDYDEDAKEMTLNYDGAAPGIADVTGLQAALDGKAASSHTHAQSDVTDLVSALAGKAASSHTHAQSDVTDLVSALSGKAAASHTHAISDVTSLQDALDAKLSLVGGTMTGALGITAGSLLTAALSGSQTWNNIGTVCRGIEFAVTDTNSAAGSTLLRLLGGASGTTEMFRVDKSGIIYTRGGTISAEFSLIFQSYGSNFLVSDPSIGLYAPQATGFAAADGTGEFGFYNGGTGQKSNKILNGTSSPEASKTAPPGSFCLVNNAGTGELWIKDSGTGNTGWVKIY